MKLFDFFRYDKQSTYNSTEDIDKSTQGDRTRQDQSIENSKLISNLLVRLDLLNYSCNASVVLQDIKNEISELEKLSFEYSNLQFSTDLMYIKSSFTLLNDTYLQLLPFVKYDDSILDELNELIHHYQHFITDLKQKLISDEKRMIESIIESTLKEKLSND